MNINRDSVGRVSSLTDQNSAYYVSAIAYNTADLVTGLTLGNGVAESYGYDANRLQLTSHTATKSGGPQSGLMNLTYSYQALAGQMGSGTTAGNAGQLMSVSGTINATTESAAYSYDDLGRLVTANQASNGSSAQRRFSYDRWGNRTAVWDAVSGGNQIQTITNQLVFFPGYGSAATNRISSVTSGSTLNYTYDAAGNVTNDGVHSYQYDAENRIANVDGGVTAQYAYDQHNRKYKKTVGSTVTHYVWEGSQVAAEHSATGVVLAENVYVGATPIARISGATTQYCLSDRLSERLMLDANGNVMGRMAHLPFGEDFGESGTQEKHHFTSYERDAETGLDYAVNREYSSGVGRFMSADPYRASGYMEDPRSWNRYSYTRNVLTNRIDPLGLEDDPFIVLHGEAPYPYEFAAGVEMAALGITFGGGMRPRLMNVDGNNPGPRGQDPETPEQLRNGFFAHHPGCQKPLDDAVKAKGGTTVAGIVATYRNTADTDDLGKNLGELKFDFLTPERQKVPLKDIFFDPKTGQLRKPSVNALTNPKTSTIYLNPVLTWTSSDAERTIVHELLHIGLKAFSHVDMAAALGLKDSDNHDYTDDAKAKKAVDNYLNGNCASKKASN